MIERNFGVFALVLVLAGCAGEVGREPRAGTNSRSGSGDTAAPGTPVPTVADLFAGDAPDLLVSAYRQQLCGEVLDIDVLSTLYQYAQQHPDDARPWLVLARDSMRRQWGGFAVRQYASAIAADDRMRFDDSVLADLLYVVRNYGGLEHREASTLIAEAWGERALPALDADLTEMRAEDNATAVDRLQDVRAGVTAQ